MVKTKFKNILIQYKGGGYDGCFWEWNYAYFDKKGKFHDIFSSGRSGCDTEDKIRAVIEPTDYFKDSPWKQTKFFSYDLNKEEDIKEFVNESNPGHIIDVASFLKENFDIEINAPCSSCDESAAANEFIPEGLEGAGGIAFQFTEMICPNCISAYTCGYCGEFMGKDHNFSEEEGYCEYCLDKS